MSILSKIFDKVFHPGKAPASGAGASATPSTSASAPAAASGTHATGTQNAGTQSTGTQSTGTQSTGTQTAPVASLTETDVEAVLNGMAAKQSQTLNWKTSIVDLMKLLDIDSSLQSRKELAQELHYSGDMNDSAAMNIWLHKQVMARFAENGGKVPASLLD